MTGWLAFAVLYALGVLLVWRNRVNNLDGMLTAVGWPLVAIVALVKR